MAPIKYIYIYNPHKPKREIEVTWTNFADLGHYPVMMPPRL